jgi:hypothetical protein
MSGPAEEELHHRGRRSGGTATGAREERGGGSLYVGQSFEKSHVEAVPSIRNQLPDILLEESCSLAANSTVVGPPPTIEMCSS